MPTADTKTVATLLREYAQRTALRGGNPYQIQGLFLRSGQPFRIS